MTHFPLLNIRWPDNAYIYYGALYELANLDMIPTDSLEEELTEKIGASKEEDEDEDEKFNPSAYLSDATI